MGSSVISAHLITHQCLTLDYCLEATVRSMMDLCDNIYINDGKSTDGTLDLLYTLQKEYGKDRVVIFEREWEHNRRVWADQKNFLLDKIPFDAYVIFIDADEVIHENDILAIRELTNKGIPAVSFKVIHFYGRPTHYIDGPAWYKRHTRLCKRSTGIRLHHIEKGCADDLIWPNGMTAHMAGCFLSNIVLYHYGNCRDPRALGRKSKKADDLYQYSSEYKGGKLAEPRSFSYAFDKVGAKVFTGSHPKYVSKWIEDHKNQATEYICDDKEINKLWCFKEN